MSFNVPAITHIDYSARIQTVHPETNPRFYQLLDSFDKQTGQRTAHAGNCLTTDPLRVGTARLRGRNPSALANRQGL